ncbi:MAG: TldD/PmbA family protein, partial [Nitrososphaerales archaeon]
PTVKGNFSNKIRKDPFDVPLEDASDLLLSAAIAVKESYPDVNTASASIFSFSEDKYIATSEGSQVFQKSVGCGPSVSAVVYQDGKALRRSYPGSFGWNIKMQGYENIEDADLIPNARTVGEDIAKLVKAKRCPKEKSDIIIYGDLLAIHVHETVGHPTESDRATDTEWDFAGSTFLTPEKLGNFQFGSEQTSITADATISGGTGSYDFDDELVPGKKVPLIKEGLFSGYQSSRETAKSLGLPESSGAMRAMYGSRIPLIRMTNINLEPSDWTREEIIKDTKNGILATGAILAIFDQRRRTYIFGGEIGWKIENHEITEPVKFPIYHDTSVNLWKNCDAVSKEDWQCFGVSCGKGRPHQSMRVGHFCSTARFRNIPIGDPA